MHPAHLTLDFWTVLWQDTQDVRPVLTLFYEEFEHINSSIVLQADKDIKRVGCLEPSMVVDEYGSTYMAYSAHKQLSTPRNRMSKGQDRWLRLDIFKTAASEGASVQSSVMELLAKTLCGALPWTAVLWRRPHSSPRPFDIFCTFQITLRVKFQFSSVNKIFSVQKRHPPHLPFALRELLHPVAHSCTLAWPIFTPELCKEKNKSRPTGCCGTERNREQVVQGLCCGEKRFVRRANANWHSPSRLHIPGDSVTTDRWWQSREVGCCTGCTGGTSDTRKEKWVLTLRWQSNPSVRPISRSRISARVASRRYHP